MTLSKWLRSLRTARTNRNPKRYRPSVEFLETRTVPSTFWVSNRNDGGAGSLRQAVLDANGHAGGDVIKFRHSAEGTITLTGGELSVTGELRIDGPGAGDLIVSGGGMSRVFDIVVGSSVRIDNLTIANGYVVDNRGGGIRNAGTLTLTEVIVADNTAAGSFNDGGGGVANTGNLTVSHSKFTGNSGIEGGGLYNAFGGTALVDRSTFRDNTGSHGAAIASFYGGATLTVQNSLITGNNSDYSTGSGGIAADGTLNVFNTTISDNTGWTSAVQLYGGNTVIRGSRIVHNRPGSATFADAAVHTAGHVRIEDTTISENIGGYTGGVVVDFGLTELVNSKVSGNVAMEEFGTGGIAQYFGELTVVDSTISDNIGPKTGGLFNAFVYDLAITNSTISGNKATGIAPNPFGYAGGITTYGPTNINNSTISGNTVVADSLGANSNYSGAAGGIFAADAFGSYSGVTIDHSTIAFNTVTDAPPDLSNVSGGVISVDDFVSIRNSIVARNSATGHDPDVTGSFVSQGHNLIGVLTDNAAGFVASDLHGTMTVPLDPRLEPLRWNGGRTRTHALKLNSPAINAGDNADAPATDQRGRDRIVDGVIDIGAFEANFCSHWGMGAGPANAPVSEADNRTVSFPLTEASPQQPSPRQIGRRTEASKRETPNWLWMEQWGGLDARTRCGPAESSSKHDPGLEVSDFGQFSVQYFTALP